MLHKYTSNSRIQYWKKETSKAKTLKVPMTFNLGAISCDACSVIAFQDVINWPNVMCICSLLHRIDCFFSWGLDTNSRLCNWLNWDTGDQLLHFAFRANWYTWNLGIIVLHKALEIMLLGLQHSFCQILLNVSAKSRVLFPYQLHVNTVKWSNKFKYKNQNQKQIFSALWCETHTLKPVYTGTC